MTDLRALALRAVPEDKTLTAFYRQDCPICMIPLPFDMMQTIYKVCCGKTICKGCIVKSFETDKKRRLSERGLCAFCRAELPKTEQSIIESTLRRAEEYNDAFAAFKMGAIYHFKKFGMAKSENMALKWYERAAQSGCPEACFNLAYSFMQDDKEKYKMLMSRAAKSGSLEARFQLCLLCVEAGHLQLAAGHALVAACAGHDESLDVVKQFYIKGIAPKNDFATALRAHQAAHDERKSNDRDMGKDRERL